MMFSTSMAYSNSGAISSSVNPAMPLLTIDSLGVRLCSVLSYPLILSSSQITSSTPLSIHSSTGRSLPSASTTYSKNNFDPAKIKKMFRYYKTFSLLWLVKVSDVPCIPTRTKTGWRISPRKQGATRRSRPAFVIHYWISF